MKRGRRQRVLDVGDALHRRVVGRPDLPPLSLRSHVGPAVEYEQIPDEYISYFKVLCGLPMDASVLDIGCGTGRFALRLHERPTFFTGRYRGFDVDPDAISWANQHVASRYSDTRFEHLDVVNNHYNPTGGLQAESLSFPYGDEEFDFAFAMSVFTHLTTASTRNYLRETYRVLRPGGAALFTWHLVDGDPECLDDVSPVTGERFFEPIIKLLLPEATGAITWLDGCGTPTARIPELCVVYRRAYVEALVTEAGLNLEAVHPGSWRTPAGGLAFQDITVLRRPPAGP